MTNSYEDLIKKYPLLYSELSYFECGRGWLPLIEELSEKLEKLIAALPKRECSRFYALQVKEKLGGLRFYMSYETEQMSHLIRKAEILAEQTCENCGAAGELRGTTWFTTLCASCWKRKEEHHD